MSTAIAEKTNGQVAVKQDAENRSVTVHPAVDVYETENSYVIAADMPGLKNEAISVSAENNLLTIRAEAPNDVDREYNWREFGPTGYFRQFKIGDRFDQDKISAEYKFGVLTVTLPLAEQAKPKQIEVKVTG